MGKLLLVIKADHMNGGIEGEDIKRSDIFKKSVNFMLLL